MPYPATLLFIDGVLEEVVDADPRRFPESESDSDPKIVALSLLVLECETIFIPLSEFEKDPEDFIPDELIDEELLFIESLLF